MFKKAKKLNKIIGSLFLVSIFSFFACTMHIFELHHTALANGVVSNQSFQNKDLQCIDTNVAYSHQNKDKHFDLVDIPDCNKLNYTKIVFSSQNIKENSLTHFALNKVPIYLKNNILLI